MNTSSQKDLELTREQEQLLIAAGCTPSLVEDRARLAYAIHIVCGSPERFTQQVSPSILTQCLSDPQMAHCHVRRPASMPMMHIRCVFCSTSRLSLLLHVEMRLKCDTWLLRHYAPIGLNLDPTSLTTSPYFCAMLCHHVLGRMAK